MGPLDLAQSVQTKLNPEPSVSSVQRSSKISTLIRDILTFVPVTEASMVSDTDAVTPLRVKVRVQV